MVVVQKISPKPVWTELYEDLPKFFLDKLDSQTEGYSEVKLVFDTYEDNSLKKRLHVNPDATEKFLCVTKFQKKRNIKNLALSKLLSNEDTKQRLTCYFGKKKL